MQQIPIQAVPSQQLTITLGNNLYKITIQPANNVACATIERNNVTLIENVRCFPFQPLLPYAYQEAGNFIFLTSNGELPNYTKFNVTQTLQYLSQDELDAFRAPALVFNPAGDLPLRYKPQGYVLAS